jgi:alkylation response protein AidB-like acyl-CoA dehydrogenase
MTRCLDLQALVHAIGPSFADGAGFYRKSGLERLLRDAHAAQFHTLSAKRQHRFSGRVALGLDPIADAP